MKTALKEILTDLLADARAHRGRAFAQPLRGGLSIHIRVTSDDMCHLEISRVDIAPDPSEWKTVTELLGAPGGTTYIERQPEMPGKPYSRRVESGRIYLVGEWQLQTELISQ